MQGYIIYNIMTHDSCDTDYVCQLIYYIIYNTGFHLKSVCFGSHMNIPFFCSNQSLLSLL